MKKVTKLISAVDVSTLDEAYLLLEQLGNSVEWFKVGKQLFTRYGPEAVKIFKDAGKKVFLDLKFHDIPNTVANAIHSAAAIGADITNVHASGGPDMLKAAAIAAHESGIVVTAVTVLTSMDNSQLSAVGISSKTNEQVSRLAILSESCGLNGVVCSGREISLIRQKCNENFILIVPGIRPSGSDTNDQKRIMTPADACRATADFIVVGRPIYAAADPAAAATEIQCELDAVNV